MYLLTIYCVSTVYLLCIYCVSTLSTGGDIPVPGDPVLRPPRHAATRAGTRVRIHRALHVSAGPPAAGAAHQVARYTIYNSRNIYNIYNIFFKNPAPARSTAGTAPACPRAAPSAARRPRPRLTATSTCRRTQASTRRAPWLSTRYILVSITT